MNSPRLSIVIPTFNSANCVEETVLSALAQTFKDVEVVIDDNASKDGTPQLLERKFGGDPRFKLFANREDLNIPRGWSRAITNATGEYRVLLHSDNLLHPKFAETLLGLLEETKAKVAYCESLYFEGKTPEGLFAGAVSQGEPDYAVLGPGARTVDYVFRLQRMIPTSSLVFHRSCVSDRPAYASRFKWDPDIELMTHLAMSYRVLHVRHPLCAIRTHEGQAGSWKDPVFTGQYKELLQIANKAASAPHHDFLLNWARSNQDVAERLWQLPKVPLSTRLTYMKRWLGAEHELYRHFVINYFVKLKQMLGTFVRGSRRTASKLKALNPESQSF